MKINDEGIILNKKKYRESSLLVTFFSLNHLRLISQDLIQVNLF